MSSCSPVDSPDLLIVDDCRLYRDGLAVIIAPEYGPAAVRTAHDTDSMLHALDVRRPDVILLSLASFESRTVMQAAHTHSPQSRLIVLGVCEDDEAEIVACAEAGVSGYHLRTGSLADLVQLIGSVIAGESPCSPRVTALLLRRLAAVAGSEPYTWEPSSQPVTVLMAVAGCPGTPVDGSIATRVKGIKVP